MYSVFKCTYFCKGTRKGLELSICSTVEVEIWKNLDIQILAHGLVLIKIDFQEQDLWMLLCRSAKLIRENTVNQLTVIQGSEIDNSLFRRSTELAKTTMD